MKSTSLFSHFFSGQKLLARSITGRSFDNLADELDARVGDRKMDSFSLIVPTSESIRLLQSTVVGQYQAIARLQVQTLENFIEQMWNANSHDHQKRKISLSIQTLLIHHLFFHIDDNELSDLQLQHSYHKSSVDLRLPFVNELVEQIKQLKISGWTPEILQQEFGRNTISKNLADLIKVYQAYQEQLGKDWIDQAGIHASVAELFHKRTNAEMANVHNSSFLPIEKSVNLVVFLGFHSFSSLDLQVVCGLAKYVDTAVCLDFCPENEKLFAYGKKSYDYLAKNDFQLIKNAKNQSNKTRSHLTRYLFQPQANKQKVDLRHRIQLKTAPGRAAEVELIAQLVKRHTQTTNLNRIGLGFYQLDDYVPLIEEIFPMYGIPFSTCMSSPILRAKTVQQALSKLKDALDPSELLTPNQFLETVHDLIDAESFLRITLSSANQKKSDELIRHEISAFRQFLAIVTEIADVNIIQNIMRNKSTQPQSTWPNIHYLNCLEIALQAGKTELTIEKNGVLILPLRHAKALWFDIMILGGLVDGEFPETVLPDTFHINQKIRGNGIDHLCEERYLFFHTLNLAKQLVYLTYPTHDQTTELAPSSFIDQLQNIADVTNAKTTDVEPIFTTESFLRQYGINQYYRDQYNYNPNLPVSLSQIDTQQLDLINHNIWVEKSRLETGLAVEYQGQLNVNEASQQHFAQLKHRSYSVSQLEQYGRCPFQYFAHRILNLAVNEDDPTENECLSGLQKGNLLHQILFDFYNERRGTDWLNELKTEAELKIVQLDLARTAKKHLDCYSDEKQIKSDLFWEIEKEEIIGSAHRTGLLEYFLQLDFERRNLAVSPKYFEVAFGSIAHQQGADPELSQLEPLQLGPIRINGKIDRIEIGDGFFVVCDYKTGYYIPKISEILAGLSLQLPIYLRATEKLLTKQTSNTDQKWKGVAGVYYLLRNQGQVKLGCGDKDYHDQAYSVGRRSGQIIPNSRQPIIKSLDQLIDIALQHAYNYAEKIAEGYFPLTSHDKKKVCRFCSFKQICRVGVVSDTDGLREE